MGHTSILWQAVNTSYVTMQPYLSVVPGHTVLHHTMGGSLSQGYTSNQH